MKLKNIFIVFSLFLILGSLYAAQDIAELTLKINWIGIRHGTPNNLDLTATRNSTQEQEITGQFISGFWIEDLLWLSTWHYTTIQCDGLHGPNWSTITWIYIKAWASSPIRVLWNTWNVLISNILDSYTSLHNPIVYIYKPTNNSNLWLANRYQDIPILKVVIPPNTTAWVYKWTIVFTLYME